MMQRLICEREGLKGLPSLLFELNCHKPLLVCDRFLLSHSALRFLLEEKSLPFFSDFTPNPDYEQVKAGVKQFREQGCDALLAIGGGSSIDVAKCIKLFCKMPPSAFWLKEPYEDTGIPLIAVPTTAGTGSEATHFAVVYYQGEKQSVAHPSLVANAALLDSSFLLTLPPYMKACTMLDALCQAMESHWSVRATEESIALSRKATAAIVAHGERYVFENDSRAAGEIQFAAHRAGQAINLTTTTAAHAMSYQLTKLYSLPHGHAVAVCFGKVWEQMLRSPSPCIHPLGAEGMKKRFEDIARDLGCTSPEEAVGFWEALLLRYGLSYPKSKQREEELSHLAGSVNPARLGNNPVAFDGAVLRALYERIVL